MRIGIIAAMQVELDELLANYDIIASHNFYGRNIYFAKYKEHEIYMGVSGIGKINAASFVQLLLDEFKVEVLINTGIAGSLDPELGTLSLVIADRLYQHDIPAEILKNTYPGGDNFPTDQSLRNLAAESVPAGVRYKIGAIASGDDFIASQAKKDKISQKTSALACDMESAAVAQIAYGAGVRCLIIRTISDEADENANESYANFEKKAADQSIHILLEILKQI